MKEENLKWFRCWVAAKYDFMRKMMWFYSQQESKRGRNARKSYYNWRLWMKGD